MNVSDCFTNLCHKAFAARQEVIDWVKNLFENLVSDFTLTVVKLNEYLQKI